MARPTDGPTARDVRIIARLSSYEAKLVENQRGSQTKSDYIRGLIRRDSKEGRSK